MYECIRNEHDSSLEMAEKKWSKEKFQTIRIHSFHNGIDSSYMIRFDFQAAE